MTIEERLEDMEREIGRMKRRNRWLLGAILLVAGGLVVPVAFDTTAFRARAQGVGTAKEIRANSFVLEDENAKTRAVLSMLKGGPSLVLWGENGHSCVMLDADDNGPRLRLYDENSKVRAGLALVKDGPTLLLLDENGKLRFAAGKTTTATPDGQTIAYPESSLILFGPDGKVIWKAIK
jgi:hypothetical protein